MEVNVDVLPYMEVNVGKKKKKAKHGEMRWTQIATSEIHISILKRNFTIL